MGFVSYAKVPFPSPGDLLPWWILGGYWWIWIRATNPTHKGGTSGITAGGRPAKLFHFHFDHDIRMKFLTSCFLSTLQT